MSVKNLEPISLYTDGACSGNPGPGGWGVVLKCGPHYKELSGGCKETTNNRMELTAVIEGLKAVKRKNAEVNVYSDSSYVVKAVNLGWLADWVAKDFKKKMNRDLWEEFIKVSDGYKLTFNWIKGHAGHPENERCDALAVEQTKKFM